jgi:hypothetical protein
MLSARPRFRGVSRAPLYVAMATCTLLVVAPARPGRAAAIGNRVAHATTQGIARAGGFLAGALEGGSTGAYAGPPIIGRIRGTLAGGSAGARAAGRGASEWWFLGQAGSIRVAIRHAREAGARAGIDANWRWLNSYRPSGGSRVFLPRVAVAFPRRGPATP